MDFPPVRKPYFSEDQKRESFWVIFVSWAFQAGSAEINKKPCRNCDQDKL